MKPSLPKMQMVRSAGQKNQRFEAEIQYMHETWGHELDADPAYNPNLSLTSADFTLAFPPRVKLPWRQM